MLNQSASSVEPDKTAVIVKDRIKNLVILKWMVNMNLCSHVYELIIPICLLTLCIYFNTDWDKLERCIVQNF